PLNEKGEPIPGKVLRGGALTFKPVAPTPAWADKAPNIAGLRGWDEDAAIKFLMTGIAYNDLPARPPMPPYHLNRPDAEAIVAFLKSLSPAPLWFFGFGLGEWLAQRLRSPWSRVAFPALLGVPYLVFAFPAGTLRWSVAIVVFLLPVVLSATLDSSASTRNLVWQDGLVLGTLAAVYLFRLFTPAWP